MDLPLHGGPTEGRRCERCTGQPHRYPLTEQEPEMSSQYPIDLAESNLGELRDVRVPRYDRSGLTTGIVHIGVGSFHRAHQAVYLDDLMAQGVAHDWAICGVGVLPQDRAMADALSAQDHLYTVMVKNPDGTRDARVIGSMVDYLFAPDDPERVVARLADPAVRIVSLTITEGGYSLAPSTGEFDPASPDVQADLDGNRQPRDDLPEGTARLPVAVERRLDNGRRRIELAERGVEAVPPLRERQRDDAYGRSGQPRDDQLGVVRSEEVVHDRPDHPRVPGPVRVLDHDGVQVVLGAQGVGHRAVLRQHADAADGPVVRDSLRHQVVEVDRLVGAVEAAHPDVHDSRRQAGSVVPGHTDVTQLAQVGLGEVDRVLAAHLGLLFGQRIATGLTGAPLAPTTFSGAAVWRKVHRLSAAHAAAPLKVVGASGAPVNPIAIR